jgi:predicted permease
MVEWLKSVGLRLKTLMRRRQLETDLEDELAFHKGMRESKPADGTRRFGNVTRLKEQCREHWTFPHVEGILDDVRYALRRVGKAPAFSVITILLMGLGIGANTTIFSLIDAVMLRSLPVRHPEELVHVALTDSPYQVLPVPFWEALHDGEHVFSGVFAWGQQQFNLARGGEARNVDGLFVSGDYFATLGVGPATGRVLTANDDFRGCPGAAVLSYGFWQSHFGGDPNAVGQLMTLNGYPVRVVGISAAGFFGVDDGNKFDVAIPFCTEGPVAARGGIAVRIMGRLKPGEKADEASARLATLSPSLFAALPTDNFLRGPGFLKMRLGAFPSGKWLPAIGIRSTYGQPLEIMMIVVGVVLLIACSNIACLLLARATARNREIAVRLAIGASRWRLVRQLLTECLLLSLAGALLGLFLARWGFALLVGFISTPIYTTLPGIFLDFSLDWRVLGFTAGVAVLASVLFAVVPSILSTRTSLIGAMKGQRAEETEHRRVFRPARWIVAVEVALSLVLLVVSGLFLKSFWKLATLDVGFDTKNVLLVKVDPYNAKLPGPQQPAVRESILARLRTLPGVTAASQSFLTPIEGMIMTAPIHSHLPNAPTGRDALVDFNFVSPGFLATLGTPLLAGRDFTEGDTAHAQPVAIINQTAARRFFREDNPVGKYYSPEGPLFESQQSEFLVIGVVKDAKSRVLREDSRATAYYPAAQMPVRADFWPYWTFEIRTALRPSALERTAADAIESVNSAVSFQFRTLEQQVNNSIVQERLLAALSGFFGELALLLATIGVYGVLSYSVAQRKKEIGIRMAVGAGRSTILRLVFRDVGTVLFVGCSVGILLALGTTKLLATLLFGVEPHDFATMAFCVTLLAIAGLIAAYLPARRASRLDPMPVLREE